jgi:excinuclease ABC subunit C
MAVSRERGSLPVPDLRPAVDDLPEQAGIYFFKNGAGEVVYIGKARRLRDRVRSYFQPTEDPKVRNIVAETAAIDYIVTGSEREASLLENNFVQRVQPKFNLRLKDDKSYPYLKMTTGEAFPGIHFDRRVKADGSRHYGPFSPAQEARRTIHLIGKFFRVRTCSEEIPGKRRRPCLEYDIGLCSAPCVGRISEADYRESVSNALLFLEGKIGELGGILNAKMADAAGKLDFEEAARLRDLIGTLEHIRTKPRLTSVRREDQDILGLAREGRRNAVYAFLMREGKVRESREFLFEDEADRPDGEVLRDFLSDRYAGPDLPSRILLPSPAAEPAGLERTLGGRTGRRVRLAVPARGAGRDLVLLAAHNAEILLRDKGDAFVALEELRARLGLPALPVRIEGFDISNTAGTETVGSMVSFVNGRPDKSGYRKYRVRTVRGPNDVASLAEVLRRRYTRVLAERAALPDLVLVDGGKPQLGAARAVLEELGLGGLPLASLAKSEELIFTAPHGDGLRLDRTSPALKILQRVRDEAHRFAVRFHRQRRGKRAFD